MSQQYNPSMPIKVFFKQIERARDLAEANGTSYTEAQLMSTAFLLIFQQGVLNDACCIWRCCPSTEHTWDNFVQHFTESNQELTELQTATQQCGYIANNVTATVTETEQTVQALEDMVRATEED
eukprot:15328519-Ditylum_brightwellii.AAC.1